MLADKRQADQADQAPKPKPSTNKRPPAKTWQEKQRAFKVTQAWKRLQEIAEFRNLTLTAKDQARCTHPLYQEEIARRHAWMNGNTPAFDFKFPAGTRRAIMFRWSDLVSPEVYQVTTAPADLPELDGMTSDESEPEDKPEDKPVEEKSPAEVRCFGSGAKVQPTTSQRKEPHQASMRPTDAKDNLTSP